MNKMTFAPLVEAVELMFSERERALREEMRAEVLRLVEESQTPSRHLNRHEACGIIGCSLPTLHKLMADGTLPFVKIGRATRFDPVDIDRYLASQKKRRAR